MKIAIVYFSQSGNTERAAKRIQDGILSAGEIEIKLMNIAEEVNVDNEFLKESKAVVFGTPTYVANMCWQMKKWFDTYRGCPLGGKLGAAFVTANFAYGGAEVALLGIHNHIICKGMLAYASGSGCGQPFIHLGPVVLRDGYSNQDELLEVFGKRIAEKALELFGA